MVNYVRPCAKLIEKTRDGARVRRRYDRPHTPCQRVLACEQVPEAVKQRLREQFAAIDPIALNDQIVHLQRRLLRLAAEHASPLGAGWLMRRSAAQLTAAVRAPRGCPRPRQVASGTDLQALIRHPGAATVPIGACSRSLPNGRSQLPLPRLVRSRDSAKDGVAASRLRECSRGSAEADSM